MAQRTRELVLHKPRQRDKYRTSTQLCPTGYTIETSEQPTLRKIIVINEFAIAERGVQGERAILPTKRNGDERNRARRPSKTPSILG